MQKFSCSGTRCGRGPELELLGFQVFHMGILELGQSSNTRVWTRNLSIRAQNTSIRAGNSNTRTRNSSIRARDASTRAGNSSSRTQNLNTWAGNSSTWVGTETWILVPFSIVRVKKMCYWNTKIYMFTAHFEQREQKIEFRTWARAPLPKVKTSTRLLGRSKSYNSSLPKFPARVPGYPSLVPDSSFYLFCQKHVHFKTKYVLFLFVVL